MAYSLHLHFLPKFEGSQRAIVDRASRTSIIGSLLCSTMGGQPIFPIFCSFASVLSIGAPIISQLNCTWPHDMYIWNLLRWVPTSGRVCWPLPLVYTYMYIWNLLWWVPTSGRVCWLLLLVYTYMCIWNLLWWVPTSGSVCWLLPLVAILSWFYESD